MNQFNRRDFVFLSSGAALGNVVVSGLRDIDGTHAFVSMAVQRETRGKSIIERTRVNIAMTEHDDYVLARFEGVLDESAHGSFDEQLHPIVAAPGGRLLVDLSQTPRITSAGIGQLVTLVSRANTKDSRVVLANPSPFVTSILNATKLTKFFEIVDTIEEGASLLREE